MRRVLGAVAVVVGLLVLAPVDAARADEGGGAQSAMLYASATSTCATGAQTTTGTAYGSVLFNATGNDTVLVVFRLRRAAPDTSYDLFVRQFDGGCDLAKMATVTTNKHGNATKKLDVVPLSTATKLWGEARAASAATLKTAAVPLA
jgi:hypothetical protein